MAFRDPSSTNVAVPSWEATSQVVAFIRDPKKFQINDYMAWRNALSPVGLYVCFESDQAIRVINNKQFDWPDGMPRPEGNNNLMGFDYQEYRTQRKDVPVTIGNRTRQNCPWDIVAGHSTMAMSQFMTLLTWDVIATLETAGSWLLRDTTSNTSTATALGGGLWGASTTALSYIQKTLHAAFVQVMQKTRGLVTMDMVRLVISPDCAQLLRTNPEILDYIKSSPFAMAQIRGELPGTNVDFGLPNKLFGYEIVVERAMRVSTVKNAGATSTAGFIKSQNSAMMLSKQDVLPGDYASNAGAMSNFSTMQIFNYIGEDGNKRSDGSESGGMPFVVETFEEPLHRRLQAHVTGDYGLKMVAPESGYLVTNLFS